MFYVVISSSALAYPKPVFLSDCQVLFFESTPKSIFSLFRSQTGFSTL
jgi:hypothetical protein